MIKIIEFCSKPKCMSPKTKKFIKIFAISGFSIFFLFIVFAISIPFLFKDKILTEVKKAANQQINAKLDFKDVSLSLIWTFPDFSFGMKDFSLTGIDEFKGYKLAQVKNFYFKINLLDVFYGRYDIKGIEIEDADFKVKILNNGKANYDILKKIEEKDKSEKQTDFRIRLNYYKLKNTQLVYDDAPNQVYLKIENLNHKGRGNFSNTIFDIFTQTQIDKISFSYAGIPYIKNAQIKAEVNLGVDLNEMRFKLLDNQIDLNALQLNANGELIISDKGYTFKKFKLSTPNTNFASVLSLLPAAYTSNFKEVKTKGSFSFNAFLDGLYHAQSVPSFQLGLQIKDAYFKYPNLALPVEQINADIQLNQPGNRMDQLVVQVNQLGFQIQKNKVQARLLLKECSTDPDLNMTLNANVNLTELHKAFPMNEVENLSGMISTDLEVQTKMSYVQNKAYDKVKLNGKLELKDFIYQQKGSSNVYINQLSMNFSPELIDIPLFNLKKGNSDFVGKGRLDNLLTYFYGGKIMSGYLEIESNQIDFKDFIYGASKSSEQGNSFQDTSANSKGEKVFDKWDFAIRFKSKKLIYDQYNMEDFSLSANLSPSRMKLNELQFLLGKSNMQLKGQIDQMFSYLYDQGTLKGGIEFKTNYLNLNQFMNAKAEEMEPQVLEQNPKEATSSLKPFEVPSKIDIHFTGNAETLIYDSYQMKKAKIDIRAKDEKLDIIDLSCILFGGNIALNGSYETKNLSKPKFQLNYNINKIDIESLAQGMPTITYLTPALKQVKGKLSSQMKSEGELNPNLYPDLNNLFLNGMVETFDIQIASLQPLKDLSEKLKIKELEKINISNTRNFIKLEKGRFTLDPVFFKHSGIEMSFAGSHGLDQTMKYMLKMRVPKQLLEKSSVGQVASEGLKNILGQVNKLGIKIDEVEFINIAVDINGTLKKPIFTPKFLGAETKTGQSLGNHLQESIKAEAEKLKAEAEAKLKAEAEKLRAEAEARLRAEAEKATKELEERARVEAERLAKQLKDNAEAKRVKDSIESALKAAKEKLLKDKLKEINIPNPFKRGN